MSRRAFSVLKGVQEGFLACTILTDLDLEECTFEYGSDDNKLFIGPDDEEAWIPEQLSKLMSLTMLIFRLKCNSDA